MATRNILKIGDPQLNKISRAVENYDERLHELLDDMVETLKEKEGVGLAAPQIGVLRRVIVVDVDGNLIEMVNPKLASASGLIQGAEGCLSIVGQYGIVERARKITVEGFNRFGEPMSVDAEDMMAVALQHEIDHLDGILFVERAIEMLMPDAISFANPGDAPN